MPREIPSRTTSSAPKPPAWLGGAEITDAVLDQRLFARAGVRPGVRRRVEPDRSSLAREANRPGVNLMVLWEEYREVHPEGYGYSRFCDLFREFERRLSPVMRQHQVAGDKLETFCHRASCAKGLLNTGEVLASVRDPRRWCAAALT